MLQFEFGPSSGPVDQNQNHLTVAVEMVEGGTTRKEVTVGGVVNLLAADDLSLALVTLLGCNP